MFSLSTKGLYGLAAILELAAAHGERCIQVKEIASAQQIPEDYLRQLLLTLKRAGLVTSIRGTHGGYALTKAPTDLTVGKILEVLEGPIELAKAKPKDPTISFFLKKRQQEIEAIFDYALEELIKEKRLRDRNIVYHI